MQKAVKFNDSEKIEVSFEFKTYIFYKDKPVLVPDNLHAFLQERFPLAFSFGAQLLKEKDLKEVEHFKTKSFFPDKEAAKELGNDFMEIHAAKPDATFGTPDGLPAAGQVDKDGIQFYGEGVQKDTI